MSVSGKNAGASGVSPDMLVRNSDGHLSADLGKPRCSTRHCFGNALPGRKRCYDCTEKCREAAARKKAGAAQAAAYCAKLWAPKVGTK
jgi:hypothetical protein